MHSCGYCIEETIGYIVYYTMQSNIVASIPKPLPSNNADLLIW